MAAASTTSSTTNTIKVDPKVERLRQKKREKLLRRLIPTLLVLPYFVGIIWTALHPIVSVITGELKCRGSYIDENGLDVHRHQVESYPLKRVMDSQTTSTTVDIGLCGAVYSGRLPISYASVECIRHEATEDVILDIARIMPAMGPMIDSTEAIAIVVGEQNEKADACDDQNINEGWYDSSDLNASVLHMIQRLGSSDDAPWLTKIVYIVSPSKIFSNNATIGSPPSCHSQANLTTVVDTFMTAYLGTNDATSTHHHVNPLPPRYSSPMIRSLLVLKDVVEEHHQHTQQSNTQVKILPQGTGGALPNLDLVFATYYAFQTHPSDGLYSQSDSIYYAGSEFRTHPFGTELEKRVKGVFTHLGSILDLDKSSLGALESYASDLAGWFGFVAAMVIGPVQPHSFALKRGIDALTVEVNIPVSKASVAAPIHPHYADLTRCMEHLLRSISNLHERLHHSVAQYTMPSPSKFVSHGEYIYPAILVSLPLVVRAASLALRDISSFQFKFVGHVFGTVVLATCLNAMTVLATGRSFIGVLIIIVLRVMRLSIQQSGDHKQEKDGVDKIDECRKSLRFITCLVSIYLHVPLLLSNYSLGFPSAVFWTPWLAILVLPKQQSSWLSKNVFTNTIMTIAKVLILIAISPSTILPFNTPLQYTLILYTPLQLLLTALWFI